MFRPILVPLWKATLSDTVVIKRLQNQLNRCWRDERVVDTSMMAMVGITMCLIQHIPQWDSVDEWDLLFSLFLKAIKRQICRGAKLSDKPWILDTFNIIK